MTSTLMEPSSIEKTLEIDSHIGNGSPAYIVCVCVCGGGGGGGGRFELSTGSVQQKKEGRMVCTGGGALDCSFCVYGG